MISVGRERWREVTRQESIIPLVLGHGLSTQPVPGPEAPSNSRPGLRGLGTPQVRQAGTPCEGPAHVLLKEPTPCRVEGATEHVLSPAPASSSK